MTQRPQTFASPFTTPSVRLQRAANAEQEADRIARDEVPARLREAQALDRQFDTATEELKALRIKRMHAWGAHSDAVRAVDRHRDDARELRRNVHR
jgi:hypothetical protein